MFITLMASPDLGAPFIEWKVNKTQIMAMTYLGVCDIHDEKMHRYQSLITQVHLPGLSLYVSGNPEIIESRGA